jgi:hypothetical protein
MVQTKKGRYGADRHQAMEWGLAGPWGWRAQTATDEGLTGTGARPAGGRRRKLPVMETWPRGAVNSKTLFMNSVR